MLKNYKIIRVDSDLIVEYRDEIISLMKQLKESSCKDCLDYCEQKYDEMCNYVCDGTAIIPAAFVSNRIVGYAWAYIRKVSLEERLHITQVVVDTNFRSKGIGKGLIQHIENHSKKCGIKSIELNVVGTNRNAYKFYEDNGFSCERILMTKSL